MGRTRTPRAVRVVRLAPEQSNGGERIDRTTGGGIRRSHPGRKRAEAKRRLVDGDREREPLRPGERALVSLLELASGVDEEQDEPLKMRC